MLLNTENLIIRNFNESDFDGFRRLILDREAQPDAIYDERFPTDTRTLHLLLSAFSADNEFLAVCLRDSGELIGFTALVRAQSGNIRNLSFCIRSDMRRHGYAAESARAAISWAFKYLGLDSLNAGAAAANVASVELIHSLGFKKVCERTAIFSVGSDGEEVRHPAVYFELRRPDWESSAHRHSPT